MRPMGGMYPRVPDDPSSLVTGPELLARIWRHYADYERQKLWGRSRSKTDAQRD